jgi:hypothetical protein
MCTYVVPMTFCRQEMFAQWSLAIASEGTDHRGLKSLESKRQRRPSILKFLVNFLISASMHIFLVAEDRTLLGIREIIFFIFNMVIR